MDLKAEIMAIFWGRNIGHCSNWEELGDEIVKVCQHHMNSYISWQHNELENAKEDIQELEIDLLMEKNNFPEPQPGKIIIKKRSNFE